MDTAPDILKVSILGHDSIHCGFHLIPYIAHTVLATLPASVYALITDTNVAPFYLSAFEQAFTAEINKLSSAKPRFLTRVITPGETVKSREGKADIEDFLLLERCTRDTVILALGGGVIGDLVGFVAATFMRGVRFVQIPTTLLAMVDSSVGGKTAIDTPAGKNLIGAFWQPEYVFIDAAFLETLPEREFSNGMAEVVKTAAIWDENEFTSLENNAPLIYTAIRTPSTGYAGRHIATRSTSQSLLLSVIRGSIYVKAHIVTIDERETGLRNLVNFGHTIGHAIEAVLTPQMLHGECVSIGMILEAEVARGMGILKQVAVGRLVRALRAYGLPVSLGDQRVTRCPGARSLGVDRLLDIMRIDKKNSGPQKKVVILSRIGATYEQKATGIADAVIAKVLSEAVKVEVDLSVDASLGKQHVKMATPGSKSISNRALVLAALAQGTCRLKNLLHSDDTQVMMVALQELKGASFAWEDGGETLVVSGGSGALQVPEAGKEIYLGNAGTAARFLTTVCTLVSAPDTSTTTVITGNARMKQRPIGPLVDALRANGSDIAYNESEGCLPLSIAPKGLQGGVIRLAASVSSQYVSSILLCAPYAREAVTLELVGGAVISQPYIDMTITMMRTFGVHVTRDPGTDVYHIPQGVYVNPPEYAIESDASSATYPLAIAAITGTTCTLENIGSESLQGDARFAVDVLKRMGCEVVQTASETTVTGPKRGGLKAIGEVDMEPMTDAFLTACALAAVAQGGEGNVTRIVGIANQRVKECNRIRAMIDQLAKFGVQTKELDDGLEVYGRPFNTLTRGASVHCYDDHRVAMAFSVLGTVVPDTIIEEKRCVEKTWPNWWDDLENKIGLKVGGVELPRAESSTAASPGTPFSPPTASASVIIIGMRGSGKTHVGMLASAELSRPFIDADAYFESKHKIGVREFVHVNGWPAFRDAETDVLKEILKEAGSGHVISMGGGVVEIPEAREMLKTYAKTGPVVHVLRDIKEIVTYLGEENARPAYGEPVVEVYKRREPWFAECANYDFINNPDLAGGEATNAEVSRFFRHITGQPNLAQNVAAGKRSYFLSLTYPDVTPALRHIPDLTTGVDAVELRVDLLRAPDHDALSAIPPRAYVTAQVAALRRATSLPIVFTVRTIAQGGAFPDNAEKDAFELLGLALRLAVEYVDVEICESERLITDLASRKGFSQIVASWHDWSGKMKWNDDVVSSKYAIASRLGDIVKIVGKANALQDNFALYDFVAKASAQPGAKPIIAINMGVEGQMSRILNATLSPVTHPLLPSKAAPGQLSFAQIQKALNLLGQLPARRYFLFGNPIAHSMSPTLHNTGFEVLGLPHTYELLETTDVGEHIKAALAAPDFGGASVTIPFKLDVIPLLDKLSPAAEAIGAVNTIIPIVEGGNRILYGDNTDWVGIRESIRSRAPSIGAPAAALVIGAGGTARAAIFALQSMGAQRIYIFNRTASKAQALVDAFPDAPVKLIKTLDAWPAEGPAPTVIVSTVPASATTVSGAGTGAVLLPLALFDAAANGVVVDMAYRPAETPLLGLAKRAAPSWATVMGVEVLLEQGYVQFETWTGRRCPKHVVSKTVLGKYFATA